MTDPIADFLTRLRNANSAYHDEVTLPHSKIKANIAEILKEQGYISDYRTEDARVGKSLVVQLKYGPSRERSIAGIRQAIPLAAEKGVRICIENVWNQFLYQHGNSAPADQKPDQPDKDKEMTPEQAKALLEKAQQREKDHREKRELDSYITPSPVEKDW